VTCWFASFAGSNRVANTRDLLARSVAGLHYFEGVLCWQVLQMQASWPAKVRWPERPHRRPWRFLPPSHGSAAEPISPPLRYAARGCPRTGLRPALRH
jgi:hypothetical protein